MSKKLLKESQVRRFMGLAGMKADIVSNTINEMGYKAYEEEKEEVMQEEEVVQEEEQLPTTEEMDSEAPEADLPPAAEEMPEPEGDAEMEITPEEAQVLAGVLEKLLAASPESAEPAMDAEPPMDAEPAMDPEPVEDEVMETLAEVDVELNEEEIVQEVAKRVSQRILKAKKAQQEMNEALGKKSQ